MSQFVAVCCRRTLSLKRSDVISPFTSLRQYSVTRPSLEEEAAPKKKEDVELLRLAAREVGRQKAAYKRQVSKLRKEYMDEYQRHKAEDEAQRDAEIAFTTRKRLERQRAKNERSVQNAIRQEELRRQTHLAFQDHLKVQQEKREEQKKLFTRARQLLIDELEQEAPLWLTTPEEVEAAFTPEAEQQLWTHPQGVIGVPNPTLDSHFWHYETHTWDMSKTYKTQQDILLEEYEEEVYNQTNMDPEYWTPERVQERAELEQKAKLRANVRLEGRRSLLKRQRGYLEEEAETTEGEVPKPKPIPSLGVLADIRAQEKEGAELMLKDPTKFFVFDRAETESDSEAYFDDDAEDLDYSGPALGTPVAIRDPLRTGAAQGNVFPVGIGKLPKPDMRSEKEKKRQEREEKLWAAAQAQARSDMNEIDMAADEDEIYGEEIDYDKNDDWDSDDEEWVKGLDPEVDSEIMNVPREFRYREEHIDWVIEKLESKAKRMQSHVRNTVTSMEQEARARMERREAAAVEEETESSFFDNKAVAKIQKGGGDVAKFEKLLLSLSEEQLLSVFAMEAESRASSDEPVETVFEQIKGLSKDQIEGLVELESFLQKVEGESKE